jgi:hypothetical protein
MIAIIGLGGVPGTGKSTLVRNLLGRLGTARAFKGGLVSGTVYPTARTFVLGKYEAGERYPGTDRLSMSAQPDVAQWLQKLATDPNFDGWNLLFEGDRLFNLKFLTLCKAVSPASRFILLTAAPEILAARRAERGDTMAGAFVKGRETKLANLKAHCEPWKSETEADRDANTERLLGMLGA